MTGAIASRYVLDREIGWGAMATVWRGADRETGELRAIKILKPEYTTSPTVVTRFVRERNVLFGVRHHNIVSVHDMVVEGDRLALILDLVQGEDLAGHLVRRGGTLPPAEAARLVGQVASALATAHAAGIVHRDVKPANVLLDSTDPASPVRLADFGISHILGGTAVTATGAFVGTVSYLSPEVLEGEGPGAPADVYAVGMMLYELVVGQPPFAGGHPAAILKRHSEARVRRTAGIPEPIWSAVIACTDRDPARRITAAALADRLGQAAGPLEGIPALTPVNEPTWEPDTVVHEQPPAVVSRRWPLVAVASVVVIAALGVLAGVGVGGTSSSRSGTGARGTAGPGTSSSTQPVSKGVAGVSATPGNSAPGKNGARSASPSLPNTPRPSKPALPPGDQLQWTCGPDVAFAWHPILSPPGRCGPRSRG